MQLDRPSTTPVPMIVAATIAAVGVAGLFFLIGSGDPDMQRHAEGMISASVIYHAGASMTPTQADRQ